MSPVPQITTYHGSPHLFGRLDPSKVGTGEGAQAYGVGAGYTAQARDVAESYTPRDYDYENALMDLYKKAERRQDYGSMEVLESAMMHKRPAELRQQFGSEAEDVIDQIAALENRSYLYKGDIPDEILPKFLDWDKPISNQKEVQQILESENLQDLLTRNEPRKVGRFTQVRIGGEPSGAEITGADLYRNLTEKLGSEKIASDYLESIGIRGIRYLDQGSRGSGEGTSNFIPFSPEDFRIQEINDRPIEEYISQGLL
jgi:hypothetical protein